MAAFAPAVATMPLAHLRRQLARLDDLDRLDQLAHQTGLLEHEHVDFVDAQTLQIGQRHFGIELQLMRLEAALRQATLHRHLAAFEADLVVTARTRLLALVTAAGRLAKTRANTTPDASARLLGTGCRRNGVQFHGHQSTFTR